jgi:hypothetical protein
MWPLQFQEPVALGPVGLRYLGENRNRYLDRRLGVDIDAHGCMDTARFPIDTYLSQADEPIGMSLATA